MTRFLARALLHDEERYPNSLSFNPDRFIKNGALDPDILHPDVAAFGYGRRICPGRFMAQDSIWITVLLRLQHLIFDPPRTLRGSL